MANNKNYPNSSEHFGIVLMIDALGVSSYSDKESHEFIEKIKTLKKEIFDSHEILGIESSGAISFGDTVIIYWPIAKEKIKLDVLIPFTVQAAEIIKWGLENQIIFRGSISIGKYVINNEHNTILGSAVFDANNWYTYADWFGIIVTPKSRLFIESVLENSKRNVDKSMNNINRLFVPYDVPSSKFKLKTNDNETNLLTIGWPFWYYYLNKTEQTPVEKFSDLLYSIPTSKNGDRKILNSMKYFKEYKTLGK